MVITRRYLVVDIGGTKMDAGIVGSDGAVTATNTVSAREGCSLPEFLEDLGDAVGPLLKPGISGIAVGVPALGDYEAGILHGDRSLFPCLDGFAMRDYLSEIYRLPCRITTDAGLFTYGVWRFGEGRGLEDLTALSLGTGIGIGVVQRGRIDLGSRGVPEAALTLFASPAWQPVAGHHFPRLYGAGAQILAEHARAGDAGAKDAFRDAGRGLAYVVEELLSLYPAEAVIVGGGMCANWDLFWPEAEAVLGQRGPLVQRTALPHAALSGGAALFSADSATGP